MRDLTTKQAEILKMIARCNSDGTFLDLDQLLDRLSYKPTKAALQFSLRFLIERGFIEKKPTELRRGAQRRVLAATPDGYEEYRELLKL
jgi:DNA-binding MarR family transcriptional regulator